MTRRGNESIAWPAVAVLTAGLILVACGQESSSSAALPASATAAGKLQLGDPLPDFELATLDGQAIRLSTLQDGEHYVAVLWYAPTCPCAVNCANAAVKELTAEKYPDLRLIGVVSDPMWEIDWYQADLRTQIDEGVVSFPVVIDRELDVIARYGATRTPTVWLADKQGRIRFWGAPENTLEQTETGYRFLLKEALDDLRAGREPAVPRMEPIGCLINIAPPS
ncbi:MAG: redoxin domain-containing protein [Candidatus Sumerlaeia bacterium]|nr:redoxin domain-containing protein [Candidatus Sumerlaeia bacterium]